MANSVNLNPYRVFIPGIHREGITDSYNKCLVKVYKPETNLLKWELEFDGFRIEDFPEYDLFNIIDGNQAEKEVYFVEDYDYDKYISEGALYGRIDKLSPDDEILFTTSEYVWLGNEVVLISDWTDEGDYWSITFERSTTEITVNGYDIATSFFGTKPKCYFSKETIKKIAAGDESKEWMHTYRIQRNRRNFVGLTIELQNIDTGALEYVGVITGISITDGTAVIDCKSILTALETELPINQIATVYNTYSTITMKELISSTFLITRSIYTGILGNILGPFCSDLPFYIDSEKINELLSKNSSFSVNMSLVQDSENKSDETIKTSEILNFLYFVTGSIPYQEQGILSALDILTPLNAMDDSVINPIELMGNLQDPKHVTSQFPIFNRVNIQTKNGSLIYTFPDGAGIKGSQEISFDLSTFTLTDDLKRLCFDSVMNFSRINQYILSVLKVEIPEDLSETNFLVGSRFKISDISEFDTFQKKGSEEFDNGIVLSREANEVEIGITTQQFFQPIAPCWKVDFVSYDSGTEIVLYDVTNLDEFLTTKTINGGEPTSVYDDYIYQSADGNMSFAVVGSFPTSKIYLLFNEDWVNLGWAGSLEDGTVPTYLKLVNSAPISKANLETVKYILWTGDEYDFCDYFFKLGVHKWV